MDTETTKKIIGLVFKSVREELGISRSALAKKVGVGVSCLRHFEQGTRNIKLKTLFALMHGLRIPMETVFNAMEKALKNPEEWLAEYELRASQGNQEKFSK